MFDCTSLFNYWLFPLSTGDEVESLLLVVELSLGEVDGGGAGGGTHEVQLGLGVVDGGGAHGGRDEGQLGVLVGLPLGAALHLHLPLAPARARRHEVERVLGVDEVLLLPGEQLLRVVDALAGEGPDAGGEVGQLRVLVSLPLGAADNLHLGRGQGQAGQRHLGINRWIKFTFTNNQCQCIAMLSYGGDVKIQMNWVLGTYNFGEHDCCV